MSRDDGMDEHGNAWSVDVIWWDFGWKIWLQIKVDCCQILTTNLTQHDSHGPDDHPKTID
jgi:hypothetical protein